MAPTPIDVFISSTCYDLVDLRAELADMLRQHSFLVRMSEDHESGFVVDGRRDSIASCLLNIGNVNAVILIIDRFYGSIVPDGHEHASRSFTHAEIIHARNRDKPVFTFIRDRSYADYEQLRRNPDYIPTWIDSKQKNELCRFIKEQSDFSEALKQPHNNWFDTFTTVADLKSRVLNRLIREFPNHIGVFARRPERLVRLYFKWIGCTDNGLPHVCNASIVNAGNGPALDLVVGLNTTAREQKRHTQGGLAVGEQISDLAFKFHDEKEIRLYCEYENTYGDRYRVELPLCERFSLEANHPGLEPDGREKFYIQVNNEWQCIS